MAPDETDVMKVKDVFATEALLEGRTEVETTLRSAGDLPVGGITEWDDTFVSIPDGFVLCNGATISDSLSLYNGSAVPDLNTNYVTLGAAAFMTSSADVDNMAMTTAAYTVSAGSVSVFASITIPNGATVTGATVYGAFGETWKLTRVTLNGGAEDIMASGLEDAEDTTISTATINNSLYGYVFEVTGIDFADGDLVNGVRVKYEPRFKFIIRIR